MKIKELFGALALLMLISGCLDSNPLERHSTDKVASFIMEHGNPAITRCSKIWARPKSASNTGLKDCDRTATQIANLLNDGGFGTNISSENVRFTPVWIEYEAMLKVRRKKAKEDLKNIFDWGSGKQ